MRTSAPTAQDERSKHRARGVADMRARIVCVLGALVCAAGCLQQARAEDTLHLIDEKSFYEALLDMSLGSLRGGPANATIVGVRVNQAAQPFDIKALYVAHARPPSDPVLCFKMISRDGRYTARAKYALDSGQESWSRLIFQTRYAEALGSYTTDDVAILAYTSPGCDSTRLSSLLVVGGPQRANATLSIQIRAGRSRVRAQLGHQNNAVGPAVLCEPIENGPAVGFSANCAIPLPDDRKDGKFQLSIGETAANGQLVVKTYALEIFEGHK
jgi:hypothetical protein